MRILFHVCCGPCFARAGTLLREEGHHVTAFWYNPNIQPYKEFQARLGAFKEVCEAEGLPTIIEMDYGPEDWLRAALDADDRCEVCYSDRLGRTALRTAEEGFDAFTSTLLASPYQEHEMAHRLGEDAARDAGVEFLYRDFREHWKECRARTFKLGVYRQKYCGCILSERDRYLGIPGADGDRGSDARHPD
jgi:predicted adenine nucleotide alpha hydrolase (AANH) superfamily ATPase